MAEQNNDVSRHPIEERRISPRGRRMLYLIGRLKNDVSRRADEERRISALLRPVHGQYTARYDVLRPRGEIRRSSTGRRDTTLFRSAIEVYHIFF